MLITNSILFLDYDVILRLHVAVMTSFWAFSLSRKLLVLELCVLHQTTQNIWFSICLQYIIESYLLQKMI